MPGRNVIRPNGLYAICDAGLLFRRGTPLPDFARGLLAAGIETVQWRCKDGTPQQVLAGAAVLREIFAGSDCRLIMNDRVDLALLAGFDGVHLGQGDLSPEDARRVLHAAGTLQSRSGRRDAEFTMGISTHTEEQARLADCGEADYIAVGPVFATGSKADAAAVVGLEGVRRARALTAKPLVAIGGITRENAAQVRAAGADAIAVISGLLVPGEAVEKVARDFLAIFR